MANKMLYPKNTKTRQVIDLSGMWKFCFNYDGVYDDLKFGLKNTIPMVVPSSFNDFFTDKAKREYTGDVFYEYSFYADDSWKLKDIDIRFFAAIHKAYVYFNGELVKFHNGGFTPFNVDITSLINYEDKNTIIVRLNNELDQTTLPVGEVKVLEDGSKISKPYFDFFNYGGLIRPVKIVLTPKKSILDITLNHRIIENYSITNYSVLTNVDCEVLVNVYDEEGEMVGSSNGISEDILIKNVNLWKPLNPYLYTFVFEIVEDEKVIDSYFMEVGIRSVSVCDNKLLINDEEVYLKGFGKHEDSNVYGRGYNPAMIKRDFELMKWIGANSFRTSHYPYSEEIYQLADKEGILVIDELASVGMFKSLLNFMDAASKVENTLYFEQDIVHTKTLKNHLDALEELIQRDKNYACVIMWSLLNEPDTQSDKALPYFEEVFNKCHELDIQKRPRTFAHIMMSTPDKCKCSRICDVIALNRYYGWYLNGGYEISEAIKMLDNELSLWDTFNKPVFFAEYGADTISGMHSLPSVMWSEEYQVEYLIKNHEIFDKYKCVIGEHIWNFADFQTTEGILRVGGNKKGVFTRYRQPKAAAYYLKSRWEKDIKKIIINDD